MDRGSCNISKYFDCFFLLLLLFLSFCDCTEVGYSKFILNAASTFEVNIGENARFNFEDGRGLENVLGV